MKKNGLKHLLVFVMAFIFATSAITDRVTLTLYAATSYSWGSSGDTVRTIQDKLKRWGYYTGSVDGKFGSLTFEAVKYFQRTNGLKEDGIVGPKTLEALGIFETSGSGSSSSSSSGGNSTNTSNSSNHENDVWLLGCIINGEGRGESYLGQVAIGAVVMNRVKHPSFPSTISGVIYQTGAFDAVKDGQINLAPSESCLNAARDALNGWDPVDGAIYYWNPKTATSKWIQTLTISKVIGNHAFAKN